MQEVLVEGVRVHHDPISDGYWLERGELQALAARHGRHVQEVEAEQVGQQVRIHEGRLCPEDGATPLVEFEFAEHSGIRLDLCPTCGGIWLDKGELTKVENYMEAYGQVVGDPEQTEILRHNYPLTERFLVYLYSFVQHPPYI